MARFRLERVRQLRRQQRQQVERTVIETMAMIAENDAEAERVRAGQMRGWNEIEQRLSAGTTTDELVLLGRYERALQERASAVAAAAVRLAAELERRRTTLLAARSEERKIDRLRERWSAREAVAAQRVAERQLDEFALRQHAARK